MNKKLFGNINKEDVFTFLLTNQNGMKVKLCSFGALIMNIEVPDKDGKVLDVALGYDTLDKYRDNEFFFGAVIAPNANRIGNASFVLDGVKYSLDANDGTNNLHSHKEKGSHKRVWDYAEIPGGIKFWLSLKDGELGFGGNKEISVQYTLSEDNELKITYDADSDKNTPINITNHCYFNLDGHNSGDIQSHKLQIFASAYTPINEKSIPIGDVVSVEGTPMDFRDIHSIGKRIDYDFEQLKIAAGYDHNWVCDGYNGLVRKIAVVKNASESRTMEVYTDLPGVQFYAGNWIEEDEGKMGAKYKKRSGLALETQYYPDSVNNPQFPSSIFGPKRHYHSTTIYKFL